MYNECGGKGTCAMESTTVRPVLAEVSLRRYEMTGKNEILSNPENSAQQRKLVEQLSEATIRQVDQALLSNVSSDWSHTSRVVLTTMIELDNGMGLPKSYFIDRVAHLVREGLLEAKGDTPAAGEVRLKSVSL